MVLGRMILGRMTLRFKKIPLPSRKYSLLSRGRWDRITSRQRGNTRKFRSYKLVNCSLKNREGGFTPPSIPPSGTSYVHIISIEFDSLVSSLMPSSMCNNTERPWREKISNCYFFTSRRKTGFAVGEFLTHPLKLFMEQLVNIEILDLVYAILVKIQDLDDTKLGLFLQDQIFISKRFLSGLQNHPAAKATP